MIFKTPSKPNHPVILWFTTLWSSLTSQLVSGTSVLSAFCIHKKARQSMDPALIPPGIFLWGSSLTKAISASTPLQTWAFFPWIPAATLQCNTQRQNHRRYSSWLCTLSYSEALAALSSLIHLHVNMIILNELQTRLNCKNISSFWSIFKCSARSCFS